MRNKVRGYYFVTDSALSLSGNEADIRSAVACGVTVIQYRNKLSSGGQMYLESLRLRALCEHTLFIVNDRLDIALACGADGVHLGQEDVPCSAARKLLGAKKLIGVTVHDVPEARKAVKDGADYLAVSPVFETGTKKDAGRPVGTALISGVKEFCGAVPVVAIGGINLYNAADVIRAGADALCAISCVLTKPDIQTEIRKFQRLFSNSREERGDNREQGRH